MRKRVGDAVATSAAEQPITSKYAAKKAARRKETDEQKAKRLGIVTELVIEEPVPSDSKTETEEVRVCDNGVLPVTADKEGKKRVKGVVSFEEYSIRKNKAHKRHLDAITRMTEARKRLLDSLKEIGRLEQEECVNYKRYRRELSIWYLEGTESEYLKEYEGEQDRAVSEKEG